MIDISALILWQTPCDLCLYINPYHFKGEQSCTRWFSDLATERLLQTKFKSEVKFTSVILQHDVGSLVRK
jgi:hypothetical protein